MQKNDEIQFPLEQLRKIRIEKLKKLRKLGVDPYPSKSYKNVNNSEIKDDYSRYEGKEVIAAGRVISKRTHGLIAFFDIKDASGMIQLYLKSDNLKIADYARSQIKYKDLDLIDEGDFIEAKGKVVKTKSGEVSVEGDSIRILVKTLRAIPKVLKDKEVRYRRRYIDTNINEEVYQRFIRRTKFWKAHREFFNSRGFYEINTPVLEHIPGGGDAVPFVTHMDSINEDFYLRISHELPLKRLVGGGYDKVYDIGPRFRNEGLSDEHLPEHVAMEFYWAYANWQDGMKLVKDLYNFVIEKVYGDKKIFKIRGFDVDFSKDWEVIDFARILQIKFGFNDLFSLKLKDIAKILEENGIRDKILNIPRGIDHLWKLARKDIVGPAFVVNHPKYLSPLQKPGSDDPNIVERFQPIIAGSELGNGWSEVNDPIDQFERFNEQQKMRDAGDKEAQWLDIDYVEMLEYGMPPTFGYGHSERVFWFLEDVPARDGVPFPQLKFELEDSTKKIYGIKEKTAKQAERKR